MLWLLAVSAMADAPKGLDRQAADRNLHRLSVVASSCGVNGLHFLRHGRAEYLVAEGIRPTEPWLTLYPAGKLTEAQEANLTPDQRWARRSHEILTSLPCIEKQAAKLHLKIVPPIIPMGM